MSSARQVGGLKNIAVDPAVTEPDRVRLSKGVVDPDVVLVLVLGIRIGIERVAVKSWIESTGRRQYRLKEINNLRLNLAGIRPYRNLVVQVWCTRKSRDRGNGRIRIVQLVVH